MSEDPGLPPAEHGAIDRDAIERLCEHSRTLIERSVLAHARAEAASASFLSLVHASEGACRTPARAAEAPR